MKAITPEECYQLFVTHTNLIQGRRTRKIKNFEKARTRKEWIYYESFAQMCNRNNGMIDPETYVKILATHHKGWFTPKLLNDRKSIKIYKSYIKREQLEGSEDHIVEVIKTSLKFIVQYCKDNNIKSLDEYIMENMHTIPTLAKHLNSGKLNMYFFVYIPNIIDRLNTYPNDVRTEFFTQAEEDYNKYRMRVVGVKQNSIQTLCSKFEVIFNKYINN